MYGFRFRYSLHPHVSASINLKLVSYICSFIRCSFVYFFWCCYCCCIIQMTFPCPRSYLICETSSLFNLVRKWEYFLCNVHFDAKDTTRQESSTLVVVAAGFFSFRLLFLCVLAICNRFLLYSISDYNPKAREDMNMTFEYELCVCVPELRTNRTTVGFEAQPGIFIHPVSHLSEKYTEKWIRGTFVARWYIVERLNYVEIKISHRMTKPKQEQGRTSERASRKK